MSRSQVPPSAILARVMSAGSIAAEVGKGHQQGLVGEHMLQDAGEKVRLIRQLTQPVERQSGRVEEPVEPFRLFGDEGKGLNRQYFRGFPRGRGGPFHRVPFAFP